MNEKEYKKLPSEVRSAIQSFLGKYGYCRLTRTDHFVDVDSRQLDKILKTLTDLDFHVFKADNEHIRFSHINQLEYLADLIPSIMSLSEYQSPKTGLISSGTVATIWSAINGQPYSMDNIPSSMLLEGISSSQQNWIARNISKFNIYTLRRDRHLVVSKELLASFRDQIIQMEIKNASKIPENIAAFMEERYGIANARSIMAILGGFSTDTTKLIFADSTMSPQQLSEHIMAGKSGDIGIWNPEFIRDKYAEAARALESSIRTVSLLREAATAVKGLPPLKEIETEFQHFVKEEISRKW